MNYAQLGEPLQLHKLNLPAFVKTLVSKGVTLKNSKVGDLHPKQVEICDDDGRFKVVACGRRFGKTLLCVIAALAVLFQSGRKVWIVSNTYELTDRVFLELFHILTRYFSHLVKESSKRSRYIVLHNGSEVYGKSCDNREGLVGEAIDLLIWDEAGLTQNGADMWNQELRPTLTDREGSAIFISTPRGKNHFYKWYVRGQEGIKLRERIALGEELTEREQIRALWSSFKFSSYCNTPEEGGYLPRKEIEAARLELPHLKFQQEYMADFNSAADRVFAEFNGEEQIGDQYDYKKELGPVFVGMDFNYSTPCTTLYAQMDRFQNIYIFDMYYPEEAHISVHTQAQQLFIVDARVNQSIHTVVADIAGKQKDLAGRSAWDDLNTWGIYPKGRKQKIEVGCELVRLWCSYPIVDPKTGRISFQEDGQTPVSQPKLYIHSRCTQLIFALESARAPSSQAGLLKEGYNKDGITDGPLDALRYLMVYLLHDSGSVGLIQVN